jgi:hypothetical protein
MRYLASRVGLAILFCFVLADLGFAHVGSRVNEAGVRLQVRSDGTVVDLPVENPSGETVSGRVLLELVDPRGVVLAHADQDASLPLERKMLYFSGTAWTLPDIMQVNDA